jgi:hypothetical protein
MNQPYYIKYWLVSRKEKDMSIRDLNLANSTLEVKASGNIQDFLQDLKLPQGKSIAELLYENTEPNGTEKKDS